MSDHLFSGIIDTRVTETAFGAVQYQPLAALSSEVPVIDSCHSKQDVTDVIAAYRNGALGLITDRLSCAELWYSEGPSKGIYAVEIGDGVKIGCSSDVPARVKSVIKGQAHYGLPCSGRFMVSLPCSNYMKVEHYMHKRFKHCHIGKELFACSVEDVADALEFMEITPSRIYTDRLKSEFGALAFKAVVYGDTIDVFNEISRLGAKAVSVWSKHDIGSSKKGAA